MSRLIDLFMRNLGILIRFGITGVFATSASLFALYLLVDIGGMWYLYATTIAYLIGFCISFLLQKFWTFKDTRKDIVGVQAILYLIIFLCNLAFNGVLMFVFVDWLHLSHIIAQAVAALVIAGESFFAYRLLVFRSETVTAHAIDV